MHIAYYCQHVLGIGHFHRSLAICRELATAHRVTLILGGPDVDVHASEFDILQLPGLEMDVNFKNLAPCRPGLSLDQTKERRKEELFTWFATHRPDIFLVELYPFGRKAFRFELDPVLDAIRSGTLSPCRCYVSLRDILVDRPDDRLKFEQRVVSTLNGRFDGLLVHADPRVVTLDETFGRMADIRIPINYTGFITRKPAANSRRRLRQQLGLTQGQRLITVSIGGGNVGHELLDAAMAASSFLAPTTYRMQLFTGPYFPPDRYDELERSLPMGVRLSRFTDDFPGWLEASDLSISMAGYNTSMNLLIAGIPALVFPFDQNREQRHRIGKLLPYAAITLIEIEDLQPQRLAELIARQSWLPRYATDIDLDGVENTRAIIEHRG